MSESSNTGQPEDDGWENFDVIDFARTTMKSIEYGDAMDSVLEERVIRLEEIVAARWPRSMFLRRLAREIRASVASWDDDYIPRGDFMARRFEAVAMMSSDLYDRQPHVLADWGARGRRPDDADPGDGFLP